MSYRVCWNCSGIGEVRCDICDGTGVDKYSESKCYQCGGSGSVRCEKCHGEGRIVESFDFSE